MSCITLGYNPVFGFVGLFLVDPGGSIVERLSSDSSKAHGNRSQNAGVARRLPAQLRPLGLA